MIIKDNDTKEENEKYLDYEERNKFLWSLRSDFAWAGKKIPESVEIDGKEYIFRDLVQELNEKGSLDTAKTSEIRTLILKLKEKAKINEELIETEELTRAEAEALYEEAAGLLRASMELKDKLKGKGGEKGADEFKRMLNNQKIVDEKRFQKLIKSLK
jgi:hypothetical protein